MLKDKEKINLKGKSHKEVNETLGDISKKINELLGKDNDENE